MLTLKRVPSTFYRFQATMKDESEVPIYEDNLEGCEFEDLFKPEKEDFDFPSVPLKYFETLRPKTYMSFLYGSARFFQRKVHYPQY